ncbi:hypothetical protein DWY21_14040 [Phocaeicola plebeius]|uniref:Uncharacterized protein n=1 Tax=Phocaeicola plebeius TaxID=310297 RepID=A0A412H2S2_9BACT|nr:hypothetical protein DWY21_14040 [Phocaeicola plebeius]RGS04014.1 hypothetical protein DWY14_13925 [Phocaeicola plebeius]
MPNKKGYWEDDIIFLKRKCTIIMQTEKRIWDFLSPDTLGFWKIIQLLCTFEKMEYLCFVIEERLCLH